MSTLRYALLRHECPPDYRDGPHWDLLLERPDTDVEARLATWSLLELPKAWSETLGLPSGEQEVVDAVPLPDHRAIYLDYEGPISGGRGEVTRVAGGAMRWLSLNEQLVEAELLAPGPLSGALTLTAGEPWRISWRTH